MVRFIAQCSVSRCTALDDRQRTAASTCGYEPYCGDSCSLVRGTPTCLIGQYRSINRTNKSESMPWFTRSAVEHRKKADRVCASSSVQNGYRIYISSDASDSEDLLHPHSCAYCELKPLRDYARDSSDFSSSSSGQSSPQTSFSSTSFLSSQSSPSSPPSSQGSLSDLSPIPSSFSRIQPRIQVSSLLSDARSVSYHLEVVQQPQKTGEFRNSPLSRLPVTPPVIVRLTVRDPSGNPVVPEAELPFLIAHLSLYSENGLTRLDVGSSPMNGQSAPILYGNLVSSIDQLEDLQGNRGMFFIFPDVSIRCRGRYRLGITLLRISSFSVNSSGGMSLAQHGQSLAETRTRPFDVLPRHQYTAVAQTRLTQSFLRQGARMFTFMSPSHP